MGYYINVSSKVYIYVEDIGRGKPLLMIHGWPVNHKIFEYQLNTLPRFGFRCIMPDLRGFGKSSWPFNGYSYNRMADDLRKIIDTLGLKDITLIGFSVGGAIAIRYMSRHGGHQVNKLILAAAAAPSFVQRENFPYGLPIKDVNALIEQTYKDRPKMLSDFGKTFFANPHSQEFKNWFMSIGLENSGHGTIKLAESLRNEDLRNDLVSIHTPTFILHGKKDQVCPFPLSIQMNDVIVHSQLIPFEQSGHGLFYDEKEKFNQELLNILSYN